MNKSIKLTALDEDNDGYISIKEYLDTTESLGKDEKSMGNFNYYVQKNLGILFILILIKNKKKYIDKIACIPFFVLCIYQSFWSNSFYTMEDIRKKKGLGCTETINFVDGDMYRTLTNIVVIWAPLNKKEYNYAAQVQVLAPPNLKQIINKCEKDKKYMIICHLTISPTWDIEKDTHANVLIFDTRKKTIERFDPHGSNQYFDVMFKYDTNLGKYLGTKNKSRAVFDQDIIDKAIMQEMLKKLPNYKYYGTSYVTPFLGPQLKADEYSGLCVTWVTMYMLLRLLNPDMNPDEITIKMIDGTPKELKNRLLRFQKFIIKTLQNEKENILEY